MKKYFSTDEFRLFNERRAKRSVHQRLVISARKRQLRIEQQGAPQKKFITKRKVGRKHAGYSIVVAPENFSFITNTNEMVAFISSLDAHWGKRHPVWVVLQKVSQISYDGIVVLLSVMIRFRSKGIKFNGDFPHNKLAREILTSSGFFSSLGLSYYDQKTYKIGGGHGIVTHGRKDVESTVTDRLLQKASKTIWGKVARCQGAQRVFIEMMQNTHNHASLGGTGEKHWWLSAFHHEEDRKVSFAFVDYGVGVFRSLRSKTAGEKFFGALERMSQNFADKMRFTDAEALKKILEGELHRTASGKYYRGKGFPGIMDTLKRKGITNLHIITNTVKAAVSLGRYEVLPENFEGTFLYWELDCDVLHCHDDES